MKLDKSFYLRNDVVKVARDLLGKVIFTNLDGQLTSGIISETEAYAGAIDKASHAYNNRRTKRTETMFGDGGIAYIYLCYGVHHLFNFVTGPADLPFAVLLRGMIPFAGLDEMERRTGKKIGNKHFSDGPGKLTRALGLTIDYNGTNLTGNKIWVEDMGIEIKNSQILVGPRIGVDYAGKDAKLPYRFLIRKESIQKNLP